MLSLTQNYFKKMITLQSGLSEVDSPHTDGRTKTLALFNAPCEVCSPSDWCFVSVTRSTLKNSHRLRPVTEANDEILKALRTRDALCRGKERHAKICVCTSRFTVVATPFF